MKCLVIIGSYHKDFDVKYAVGLGIRHSALYALFFFASWILIGFLYADLDPRRIPRLLRSATALLLLISFGGD